MKTLKIYENGFLNLFKAMTFVLLGLALVIALIVTIPIWWSKLIQKLLMHIGNVIVEVLYWQKKEKQQVYNKTLEFEGVYKVLRKKEKALDEIEGYCEKILSDLLHYSQGTINTAEKIRNIINNAKEN